ncbi:preprotein translocase subunit SecA [Brucella ceti TE28753-12]|nr:preprotein translocase subunit SecA [Brucella ceti TE28753-12]
MVSFGGLARKIFGSSNDRRVKTLRQRQNRLLLSRRTTRI